MPLSLRSAFASFRGEGSLDMLSAISLSKSTVGRVEICSSSPSEVWIETSGTRRASDADEHEVEDAVCVASTGAFSGAVE
jgi:hypothetical protein